MRGEETGDLRARSAAAYAEVVEEDGRSLYEKVLASIPDGVFG